MISYYLGIKSLKLPFLSLLFCLLSSIFVSKIYGVLASKILNSLAPPSEEEFTGSVDGSNLKNDFATSNKQILSDCWPLPADATSGSLNSTSSLFGRAGCMYVGASKSRNHGFHQFSQDPSYPVIEYIHQEKQTRF